MADLARTFNTAVVASRAARGRNHSSELFQLMETPAFQMILHAARSLARTQGVSERDACEQIIDTFRKVDQLWADYVFQEGMEKLKLQPSSDRGGGISSSGQSPSSPQPDPVR